MRKFAHSIILLMLSAISACSSSGGAAAVPPTPTAPCKDGACIQKAMVSLLDNGDLSVLFVLTDQVGQVNAARPPQFTQGLLGVEAYQIASDQAEKLAFEQELASQDFICWVTNIAPWTKGQLSAVCGFPVARGSTLLDVKVGDRLKVKLDEFNFEQVVEVTNPPEPSANNASPGVVDRIGGTRLFLAPTNCPGTAATSRDIADQLKRAGEIIWYRLSGAQVGGPSMQVAKPVVIIEDCGIIVDLPPLGDPWPFIQIIQQPGRFELIDSGSDYHAPGTVLRTTGHPSPTVPISTGLQSAVPPKQYEVVATNADLDFDQLVIVNVGGGNSQRLQFGFYEAAAQKLAKVTTAHSVSMNNNDPYYLCIMLDNVVESCPSVNMPIINGRVVFGFSDSFEAQRLASILRNGELPLELQVIKTETIYSQSDN